MQLVFHQGLLAAVVLLASPAQAQVSVEASPMRVELRAKPGDSSTQAVTLTNVGPAPVRVRASLADWHLSRDGAPQFAAPEDGRPFAAAAWVRFAPPEFVLAPGGSGTVRFTLTVPADAGAAGYRTSLLFDFLPETPDPAAGKRQVLFRSRIATLVYVHVGEPPAAVELTNLEVRSAVDQTQVVAALRNTSRRSVRTRGTLRIYDRTGLAVREILIPDVPVLPESERDLAITAVDAASTLLSGDYRVELKLDLGMPALVVGETTLRVSR
ncbi:MAG TPA: hypothetical protein VLD67_02455 [Vicinamibacterales bacterium]|nr:hypothetical protein [Vicinamibacterales bacterium]